MDCRDVDILIIGAGPAGLGAAKRLNQIVRLSDLSSRSIADAKDRTVRHG